MSRKALWITSMSGLVARSAASLITAAYTQEKFTQASHSAGESLCLAFWLGRAFLVLQWNWWNTKVKNIFCEASVTVSMTLKWLAQPRGLAVNNHLGFFKSSEFRADWLHLNRWRWLAIRSLLAPLVPVMRPSTAMMRSSSKCHLLSIPSVWWNSLITFLNRSSTDKSLLCTPCTDRASMALEKRRAICNMLGGCRSPPLKDNIILMNPVSTASRFKRTLTLTAHVTMKFHVQKNTHWQDMPLQNFSQVLQTKLEPFEPSCTNWNKPSLVQGSEKGFELLLSLRGCRVQITGQQHSEQNALDLREALHNVDAQGFDFHFLSSEPRHLEQILNQQAWVNLLACDGLKQHSVLGSLGPCRKMSFDLKSSFKAALRSELIHPQVHEPSRRQRTPSVPRLSASLQGSATHRSEGSALTASWQVSTWFRS